MRAAGGSDRLVGAAISSVVTPSSLQGLQRMCDSSVLRGSKAGVKRNVHTGENPVNVMMAVLCGRKTANTEGLQTRATKKHKK